MFVYLQRIEAFYVLCRCLYLFFLIKNHLRETLLLSNFIELVVVS